MLPVLVLLLVGIFVVGGLWVNAKQVVVDAAREGAREAAVLIARDPTGWQQTVAQDVQANLQGGGLQTAPANYDPQWPYTSGDLVESYDPASGLVTVTVIYHDAGATSLFPGVTLQSSVSFLVE